MTVQELIAELEEYPPMMEVYVQILHTALTRVKRSEKNDVLGIVELHYE